jgi:radical SAM superfamily enzyme YgiQ (UPF0313 family)
MAERVYEALDMDVLFIDPPWFIESDDNIWKHVRSCWPSLGIAYIASYLEQFGFSCGIIDCTAERIAVADFEKKINCDLPTFIGITATTPLIDNGLKIAKKCRRLFPNAKIVFGGVHPTVLPEEVLKEECVDFVVRGEGEETTKELLQGKDASKIMGLSYKIAGEIFHNPDRSLINNLDSIPPPAYHLLPMKKYYPAVGSYKRLPAMSIFATRGCPGKCTFCYRIFDDRVRSRSAGKIIEEVKLLQKDYGVKEICFYDDTFTINREIVAEFCSTIISEGLDLYWSCFTRIDCVGEEMLRLMKKAGCHLILFGVESADQQILKNIKKNINLDKVKEVMRAARRIGVETRASYMFGNPGETEETIKKTMKFAKELDTDEVQFNIATPYPGTEFFDWVKKNGYLISTNWYDYNISEQICRLPTVNQDFLAEYYNKSHLMYYLRLKIIIRRLLKVRSPNQIKQEIIAFLAVIKVATNAFIKKTFSRFLENKQTKAY